MALTVGYLGDTMVGDWDPRFPYQRMIDPPLASVASTNLVLYTSEINQYDIGGRGWNQLNPQEQAAIAMSILHERGDLESQKQADALALSNPSYRNYHIVNDSSLQTYPHLADYDEAGDTLGTPSTIPTIRGGLLSYLLP